MNTETEIYDAIRPKKVITKKLLIILSVIFFLIALLLIMIKIKYPTASPFSSAYYIAVNIFSPHKKMDKQVVGFLPYWRMDDIKYIRFDLLSELIFFSLTIDENGDIVKVVGNETDPGWRWWASKTVKNLVAKTQISGGKISLTAAMLKNSTLESFLDNQKAQTNLIAQLLELVKTNHLDGINLDFEYDGELPDESYREKFTNFAALFSQNFEDSSPETELSIDLYATSVTKPRLLDVAKLAPLFDKVIVMSYDYYASSSKVSGPIAPMGGYAEGKYYYDVTTTYNDYLQVVPKDKIIMGIPYYTYDYPVEVGDVPMSAVLPQDDTNGYTSILSYGRMREDANLKNAFCSWDNLAQENFCYYQDPLTGKFHQVWIEDNKSIKIKFDYAKNKGLGGIAIWALGYDKPYNDLWNMIYQIFEKKY